MCDNWFVSWHQEPNMSSRFIIAYSWPKELNTERQRCSWSASGRKQLNSLEFEGKVLKLVIKFQLKFQLFYIAYQIFFFFFLVNTTELLQFLQANEWIQFQFFLVFLFSFTYIQKWILCSTMCHFWKVQFFLREV